MDLFLTPASISYIAQTIIFLGITVFLVLKNNGTKANFWLGSAYFILIAASLAGFIGVSSLQYQSEGMVFHDTFLVIGLALLTQFANNFSGSKFLSDKKEKFIFWVNNLLIIISIFLSVNYFLRFLHVVPFELIPIIIKIILILEITWLMIYFIFLTIRLSTSGDKSNWYKRFLHPQGRPAYATQGFGFSIIGLWVFWLTSILLSIYGYNNQAFFIFTLATLWALTFFVISLIDHTIRQGSFYFKFILVVLLTTFTGISVASWITAPANTNNFYSLDSIPNHRTIKFRQNNAVYTISNDGFQFSDDLGVEISFPVGKYSITKNLDFTFPFSGKNWKSIQVNKKGFILMNETPVETNQISSTNNLYPLIATMYVQDLVPSDQSAVFFYSDSEKAIVTWFTNSNDLNKDLWMNTQLLLFPDGSFKISYKDVRMNNIYDPYMPKPMNQVTGFFLGSNDTNPTRVKFNSQLPLTSVNWKGVYQDYYIDFRNYIHWPISMQFIAMLSVFILLVILYPLLINNNLVKPIKALRNGISRITHGDLNVNLEPKYSDDIGQTTYEFNQMTKYLQEKFQQDETKLHGIEEKLTSRTLELKQSLDKLTLEISNRKKLKANLDKLIQQNKKLDVIDEFGCFSKSHFMALLADEIKRAKRYNSFLSLVIIDPDYLRIINETYGYTTGNEVLFWLSQLIKNNIRETDILGRISGDQFAIIMVQTAGKEAVVGSNRIKNLVGENPVETSKGQVRLSASFGVVELTKEGIGSVDLLVHQATLALDSAKNQGRNRVVLYDKDLETEA